MFSFVVRILRHLTEASTLIAMIAFALLMLPTPLNLDTLSLERATLNHGKFVVASLMAAKPVYTLRGFTMVGVADHDEFIERGAVLKGDRLAIEQGKRIIVVGTLRVIRHRACVVEGVAVPEWYEIRVAEQ
ncbi:MAG: hypothetical protein C0467_22735 [Planctomycetaceae bacterium]|nr:hypothetical protein [Planctomycetaceae bacterium]